MKAFVHTIAVILVFASCYTNTAKGNEIEMPSMVDSVGSDYTANATAIEHKKQEMLALADSVGHIWFSDDTEFQSQDPNAYRETVIFPDDGRANPKDTTICIDGIDIRMIGVRGGKIHCEAFRHEFEIEDLYLGDTEVTQESLGLRLAIPAYKLNQ